jgi:hypothetical protein
MSRRVGNYSPRQREGSETEADFRRAAPAAATRYLVRQDYSADYIQEKTALASRDARQRPVSHAPKQSRSPSVEFNLGRNDRSIGLTRTFDLDTAAICNLLAWVVELRGAVRHHPGARHGEGQRRAGSGQI